MRRSLWLAAATAAELAALPALAQNAPPAVYTLSQAQDGATVYTLHCASCHGARMEGDAGPPLRGHAFRQITASQGLTAYKLLNIISQSEPEDLPGSLNQEQYGDVVAYILQQNGYPAGRDSLSADSLNLRELDLGQ
ncbi:MAG: c-type cytochrome [Rhizomicrobium sp.]